MLGDHLSRCVADKDENIASIGRTVLKELNETLGIKGADYGGLVLVTSSAFEGDKRGEVTRAAKAIAHLGGIQGPVKGANYACSSFPKAVEIGLEMTQKTDKHIALITAEIFARRFIDWSHEQTAMLFGDRGAGTTISPDGNHEILSSRR